MGSGVLRIACLVTVVVIPGLHPPKSPAEGIEWTPDFAAAKNRAKAEGKDLFILFTGRGWCAHCDILEEEVLSKEEFAKAVNPDYVCVELDFNFGDSPEEEKRKEAYSELRRRYLAWKAPTIVLADADGVPYAAVSGYPTGTGPNIALALIRSARARKATRDRHFAAAESCEGKEKAEHLHKGIQSVALMFSTLRSRGDDPVLVFYKPQVEEILDLEDESGELRSHYEARKAGRDASVARESVFEELKEFNKTRDYKGAIEYIAEALKTAEDAGIRRRLECSRQTYLEWDGQHEAALANARRLAADPKLSRKHREDYLDREAYNLFNLGRIDEAMAHYDRRLAEAEGDPASRARLLREKAGWLSHAGRTRESIEFWKAYRETTKPGTEAWFQATAHLMEGYEKCKDHPRVIALCDEFLEYHEFPGMILQTAASYIALGEIEEARKRIDRGEAAIRSLEQSGRRLDKESIKDLYKVLGELREKVEK